MCNEHQKTYAWYDMEQQIMKCWEVVEDLKLFVEKRGSNEALVGMAEMYSLKFQKLWDYYEQATYERFEERKKQEVREGWHQEWVPDTENPWREETKDGNVE